MEYVMAKIDFSGNDDINFQGFVVMSASSIKDVKEQIKEKISEEFDGEDYITIYSSDNEGTPFESEEDVFDKLTFKEMSKECFEEMQSLLGQKGDKIEFGHVPSFMEWEPPKKAKKLKV